MVLQHCPGLEETVKKGQPFHDLMHQTRKRRLFAFLSGFHPRLGQRSAPFKASGATLRPQEPDWPDPELPALHRWRTHEAQTRALSGKESKEREVKEQPTQQQHAMVALPHSLGNHSPQSHRTEATEHRSNTASRQQRCHSFSNSPSERYRNNATTTRIAACTSPHCFEHSSTPANSASARQRGQELAVRP